MVNKEKTLVLPLVAMGNVPQYAVQMVLDAKKKKLRKVTIDSVYVYPFSGRDMSLYEVNHGGVVRGSEEGDTELATPWELYVDEEGDTDYMQMHAPIIPGCETLYIKQFVGVVSQRRYGRVVVLDAVDRGLSHGGEAREGEAREGVTHWANRTVGGLALGSCSGGSGGGSETGAGAGPAVFVRALAGAVEALAADVAVESWTVAVYEGWNAPAATALLSAAGLGLGLGHPLGGLPAEFADGLPDETIEGVYN